MGRVRGRTAILYRFVRQNFGGKVYLGAEWISGTVAKRRKEWSAFVSNAFLVK